MKATRAKGIEAFCHDCMGQYSDGKTDCENVRCALYTWMPYRKKEPDLEWMKYNHRRSGKVLKEDSKRTFTDEQRQAAADRLRTAREKKNV